MQLRVNEHGREIKDHGTYEFPVRTSHEQLFAFDRHSFSWHWHTELEWTYIIEGSICYHVNDQMFHLNAGQGIICNSNVLHMGKQADEQDCHYVSITVHPRLFEGFKNSFLDRQYVEPIINHTAYSYVLLDDSAKWKSQILSRLSQIEAMMSNRSEHDEFRIYLLLMENWLTIWEYEWGKQELSSKQNSEARNMERLKIMFQFIHEHYSEKIKLSDIASQVNICQAECCRLFKKYMKISMFEYILDYRIERSIPILLESSVALAAENSGFSSPAYYTKIFKERIGCTPKEYKKNAHQLMI